MTPARHLLNPLWVGVGSTFATAWRQDCQDPRSLRVAVEGRLSEAGHFRGASTWPSQDSHAGQLAAKAVRFAPQRAPVRSAERHGGRLS